jgi:hypothetical protein
METLVYVIDHWFWLLVPSILVLGAITALPTALLLVYVVKDTGDGDGMTGD